jgi:hypothetical protein
MAKKMKKMKPGGITPEKGKAKTGYTKTVAAGINAGWKIDQPGAFKTGFKDTANVTYLKSPKGEYAGVKKSMKKGGAVKSKKK